MEVRDQSEIDLRAVRDTDPLDAAIWLSAAIRPHGT
jgi:hypothetical protein